MTKLILPWLPLVTLAVAGLIWGGSVNHAVGQLEENDERFEEVLTRSIENRAQIDAQATNIIRLGQEIEQAQGELAATQGTINAQQVEIRDLIRRLEATVERATP